MNIGLIGLGKMGLNLARHMIDDGYGVVGYDKYLKDDVKSLYPDITFIDQLESLLIKLEKPRVIWLMVPSGDATEQLINELSAILEPGDIMIDGGNSRYTDTTRRFNELKKREINFIDCGTSGGTEGARYGASLMVGGEKTVVESIKHLFEALAVKDGYAYMGSSGSGHFVKMVHNGIEYGMMQAIGEGFDLLNASQYDLDYKKVARVWANGSIIKGLLMDTVLSAFTKDQTLDDIVGKIDDSGEGQWTIEEALLLKVSIPVIAHALFTRYKSKDDDKFSEKVVAAMRNEFGGHKVYKK
ncbi:phosphogluconate dehydrogenase (NAD(+)-dependent, decarboxylating) [Peloplasma aerotolerans]|uniref:Decarboxylating 6-phosphogluconate dehydrogenase n=1 Tax=Peloplasma aerotolerans TaxID=3044389 RepID=A0AAW6U567_9MOLU|nr:decarboxylating 6-phosphogluconate dehydrogenase [Mariniplasma sp. M4Ah]MDI6453062.1 decarboxylating 6-phosphogluconate dehydrogenase [Mariniplasma sp. M4Ah]